MGLFKFNKKENMHRMNYENRLMNASASNHFPDKYAHTYSFSPQPPPHHTPPPPPSAIKYMIFLALPHRNVSLLRHHNLISLDKSRAPFSYFNILSTPRKVVSVCDLSRRGFEGCSPPCRLLVREETP